MGNRTAKFIAVLFVSAIGAPLAAWSQAAPGDAEDCLSAPKGVAPQGQHWYYRLERGTKRQCWYLREVGAKAAQRAQPAASANAAEPPASRSMQDAHAELTWPQTAAAGDVSATIPGPSATVTPSAAPQQPGATPESEQQPAVTSRWPDVTSAPPQAAPPPAAEATVATARQARKAAPSIAPAAAAMATASVPADKPTASLQTLLLVIGGALALAGIIASLVYRFAGSTVRVQAHDGARRRVDWDKWESAPVGSPAPWADDAGALTEQPRRPRFEDASAMVLRSGERAADMIEVRAAEAEPAEAVTPHEPVASDADATAQHALSEGTDAEMIEDAPATAEQRDDDLDIDIITQMLERLAKEGPKLDQPTSAADSADFSQSRQDQPGVRA